jgi:hypothetical protein
MLIGCLQLLEPATAFSVAYDRVPAHANKRGG